MSFKIIGKAFDIPLKANDKLVFLSLCEYANDEDNTCYPSLKTLMVKATISRGALSYSLNVLENLGFISREHRTRENGSATSTKYTVYVNTVLDEDRYKKRQSLIKMQSSNNERGGGVQIMNNPSSDNEQPKGGHSSDNEPLEPLANSFNPNFNPYLVDEKLSAFDNFITLLKDLFKTKKILTFEAKINTSVAKSKFNKDCDGDLIANRYSDYVLRNKNKAIRLDKYLVAHAEGNLKDIEFSSPTQKKDTFKIDDKKYDEKEKF